MKRIKLIVVAAFAFMIVGIGLYTPNYVHASAASQIQSGVTSVNDGSSTDLGGSIKTVVNVLLYILGAIAVVMIVIGGIRYTTSNGDSSNTKAAKDTILYAVVGLIIAIMAYAIVNFVVGAFK
jgi:hypothetical protein